MKAALFTLKRSLEDLLAGNPLGRSIDGFELEEDNDDDGFEFIRVRFEITPVVHVSDQKLIDFIEHLENVLAPTDDRVVSVRFKAR
jgi:hypothetical protein